VDKEACSGSFRRETVVVKGYIIRADDELDNVGQDEDMKLTGYRLYRASSSSISVVTETSTSVRLTYHQPVPAGS
jgi:hypothetical protein